MGTLRSFHVEFLFLSLSHTHTHTHTHTKHPLMPSVLNLHLTGEQERGGEGGGGGKERSEAR